MAGQNLSAHRARALTSCARAELSRFCTGPHLATARGDFENPRRGIKTTPCGKKTWTALKLWWRKHG